MSSDIPGLYIEQWQVKAYGILTPCGDFDFCMQKLKITKTKIMFWISGYYSFLIFFIPGSLIPDKLPGGYRSAYEILKFISTLKFRLISKKKYWLSDGIESQRRMFPTSVHSMLGCVFIHFIPLVWSVFMPVSLGSYPVSHRRNLSLRRLQI